MNKILYIDKNANLFKELSYYLMSECIIDLSNNISDYMNRINDGSYSLVLINSEVCTDWINCTSTIRKNSNIPVLITSSSKNFTDRKIALQIGADDYIVATSDLSELSLHIKSWIQQYTIALDCLNGQNSALILG